MTRFFTTRIALPLMLALVATTAACTSDGDLSESTLLVVNESDFVIEELFIADVDASGWGPNLLAGEALFPGEDILITDIECDVYDVLLVDEEGVECELLGIDLCFDDATWIIENETCTIFAADEASK